jgi:hypothetical protein
MARVAVPFADLPLLVSPSRGTIAGRHLFEGAAFGLAHLTVVVGESHPGQGVPLHRHDVCGRARVGIGDPAVAEVAAARGNGGPDGVLRQADPAQRPARKRSSGYQVSAKRTRSMRRSRARMRSISVRVGSRGSRT